MAYLGSHGGQAKSPVSLPCYHVAMQKKYGKKLCPRGAMVEWPPLNTPLLVCTSLYKYLTRLPSQTTSSRWQVDKGAIGLSRVQQFSHLCVARPYQISVNSIFKHIYIYDILYAKEVMSSELNTAGEILLLKIFLFICLSVTLQNIKQTFFNLGIYPSYISYSRASL